MPDGNGPQSKQSASSDAERRSRRAAGAGEAGACALRNVLEDPQGPMGCALLLRVQLKASAAAYLQQECWVKR